MTKKLISYIFPIYNEAGNIDLLYRTIVDVLKKKKAYDYELIFINDGSKDQSLELLTAIQSTDKRVIVIDLSRNYGHQMAVTAGLNHSHGDAVIIMDSDLQDPPEVSLELLAKWSEGFQVVYAQRRTRKDTLFKKLTAHAFYTLLSKLADIEIPQNTGDFRLIDRQIVDELKKFKEHDRFLRGLVSYVGFNQTAVMFDRHERHAGVTGYPLRKMLKFAADGITSFSTFPLKLIRIIGTVIAGLSLLGVVYAVIVKLFIPQVVVAGWAFIVISILFIGGIQTIMLSVLGSYIGRIFNEVKGRPLYLVKRVYDSER